MLLGTTSVRLASLYSKPRVQIQVDVARLRLAPETTTDGERNSQEPSALPGIPSEVRARADLRGGVFLSSMNTNEIQSVLTEHIRTTILGNPQYPLTIKTALVEGGILDSFDLVSLVGFIEDSFAVNIPDSEMTLENVGTIDALASLVIRRSGIRE